MIPGDADGWLTPGRRTPEKVQALADLDLSRAAVQAALDALSDARAEQVAAILRAEAAYIPETVIARASALNRRTVRRALGKE